MLFYFPSGLAGGVGVFTSTLLVKMAAVVASNLGLASTAVFVAGSPQMQSAQDLAANGFASNSSARRVAGVRALGAAQGVRVTFGISAQAASSVLAGGTTDAAALVAKTSSAVAGKLPDVLKALRSDSSFAVLGSFSMQTDKSAKSSFTSGPAAPTAAGAEGLNLPLIIGLAVGVPVGLALLVLFVCVLRAAQPNVELEKFKASAARPETFAGVPSPRSVQRVGGVGRGRRPSAVASSNPMHHRDRQ